MNAAAEVLTDHEHGLAGRAGVDVRTHAQASAVKSLIATVRAEEAVKQADLVQALKDCLEMLYLEGYLAGPGTTVADAEAALAKAGVA